MKEGALLIILGAIIMALSFWYSLAAAADGKVTATAFFDVLFIAGLSLFFAGIYLKGK